MKPSKRDNIKSPKWIVHEIPPFSKNVANLRKMPKWIVYEPSIRDYMKYSMLNPEQIVYEPSKRDYIKYSI